MKNDILTWLCLGPILISLTLFAIAAVYDRCTKYREFKHD